MIIFSNERSFFAFFTHLTCLDHIPFELPLFGPSRYKFTVKIRALAWPVLEIYRVIDCVHHSLPGFSDWIRWQDRMQQGAADWPNRVINSANEVSNPVKWAHMLAKGGLGVHNPTSWTRFVMVYISDTGYARALIFTVDSYLDGPNKGSPNGMWSTHVRGVKNSKNERSFEKMITDFDNF